MSEYTLHVFMEKKEKYLLGYPSYLELWFNLQGLHNICATYTSPDQGPVVQRMVSLTSSLMTNSLTVVTNAKATHIFQQKISMYLQYFKIEILTSS